jgi:hypothetical protein
VRADEWLSSVNHWRRGGLQLISDIAEAKNSDTVMCGCFGLYPTYVAGFLNSVKSIDFYVVCTEKPNYGHYIQQCVEGKNYTIRDTGNNLLISYDNEIIFISFETRIVHTELPSTLTLAYNVLPKMRISSLAYGTVFVNGRMTFITSEVLTSGHDCVSNIFAYNLHAPMQLADCKVDKGIVTGVRPNGFLREHCFVPRNHIVYTGNVDVSVNCVKSGPASLKSLCVYKQCTLSY